MRKPILVKLTMVILLFFLLSACDGGNVSFKQKAAKMKVELDGYSIVTRKYIQTNQKKTNFDALIKEALDDLDISYHKDRFIRYQVTYKDKHVMFTYKLRTDKEDPRKSHYVLGVIDTTSLKVSILRTFGAYGGTDIQTFVDLFDHTHALIKTKDAIEYVVLQTNEVIKTFEVEPLASDGKDQRFAYIDEELVVVSFDGPTITETRYVIDGVIYNQIKGDYLLSIRDKVAYNYKTGETSDYDQVFKDPFYLDEYTYEITWLGKTYQYDDFMGLSNSLKEIHGYAKEGHFVFNETYFVENSNGSFLVLNGYFGGLMFMQSYTPYYYFKYEDETFKYLGYGDFFFDAY